MIDTEEHNKITCFPIAYLEKWNMEPLSAVTSVSINSNDRGSEFCIPPCHIKNEKPGRDVKQKRKRVQFFFSFSTVAMGEICYGKARYFVVFLSVGCMHLRMRPFFYVQISLLLNKSILL